MNEAGCIESTMPVRNRSHQNNEVQRIHILHIIDINTLEPTACNSGYVLRDGEPHIVSAWYFRSRRHAYETSAGRPTKP